MVIDGALWCFDVVVVGYNGRWLWWLVGCGLDGMELKIGMLQ